MRKILALFFMSVIFSLSSCTQCNVCEINTVEKNLCTNSLLDRSKAKANCIKDGGNWLQVERQ